MRTKLYLDRAHMRPNYHTKEEMGLGMRELNSKLIYKCCKFAQKNLEHKTNPNYYTHCTKINQDEYIIMQL